MKKRLLHVKVALVAMVALLGGQNAQAYNQTSFYGGVNVSVQPTGAGKVYASTNSDAAAESDYQETASITGTYYGYGSSASEQPTSASGYAYLSALPSEGYTLVDWYAEGSETAAGHENPQYVSFDATSTDQSSPTTVNYYALFGKDYTSAIANADLSSTDATGNWTLVNTKGIDATGIVKVGSGQSDVEMSQTISLPAGKYRLTVQAAYRYGSSEAEEYQSMQDESVNTKLAYLTATTAAGTDSVAIQNRYDGALYEDSIEGAVRVNTYYFVPNSSAAVKAWFEKGQYKNELEFEVEKAGDVKIAVIKPEAATDYTVIGAWSLVQIEEYAAEEEGNVVEVNYNRVINQGYSSSSVEYNVDTIKSILGVEDLDGSDVTKAIVDVTTGTYHVYPADYGSDGWLNSDGDATTWGNGSYVCLKVPTGGSMALCTMSTNEPAEGTTFTAKWALYTATDTVILKVNINFVDALPIELTLSENVYNLDVSYLTSEGSYTEKTVSLSDDDVTAICTELGISSLSDATVYGYNPSTEKIIGSYAAYDGWRDANGDFATWTGTATVPVCVKYTDGQNYLCYNIQGSAAGAYAAYWIISNGTNGVLVKTNVAYNLFAEGKYYLYNTEAGKFWGAGNSWGTQASLVDHAEYLTLHPADGKYTIESQVSNGGTAYYFNGSYMDNGSPVSLTIAADTAVAGAYTITNGDAVYGYDGSTTVLSAAAEGDNALWNILTEDDMKAKLAAATADAPADATWLILDPGFGRNNRNQSAWTIEASNKNMSGGNNINNCAESYHSTFTLSQTLTGVPNGVYGLTAQGFYRQDGTDNDNLPVFYINDATSTFPVKTGSENSMSEASVSFSAGSYTIDPMVVQVTDSTITLGAKNEANTTLWCIWDNFVLTYYGADADINQVQLASAIETYKKTLATAEELAADSASKADMSETVAAALAEAIATYAEATVLDSPTAESLAAATEALNAAVANANASVNAKATVAEYEDIISKNNFVTAEALATYQALADNAQAGWETGNTEAVVAPYSTGWHAANVTDDYLLSTWSIGDAKAQDYSTSLYINTWSVEGNTDGSEFHVPFFEYWTGDANSLGAQTLSATLTGLTPGKYSVSAWTRVRLKNNVTDAPTGIKFVANDGDTIDVTTGAQVGTSQMYLDTFTAEGTVGEDSTLTIKYIVEDGNNISWLSFKNIKYERLPNVDTIEYAFESEVGGQYEGYTGTVDMATILADLGATSVDELNIYAVQSDGTLDSNYKLGTTDGWRNAAGDWQTWNPGGDTRLCVKADFSLESDQLYYVGGMNNDGPATYKATYALSNATEGVTSAYDVVYVVVSLTYVTPPPVVLDMSEHEYDLAVSYSTNDASYTEKTVSLSDYEALAICTELGIDNLSDAIVYGYNPTTEEILRSTDQYDGWRAASGDFATWTGTATVPVCVKYTDGQTYLCYNINGTEAGEYAAYWILSNGTAGILVKTTVTYESEATAIDGVADSESAPKGIYNINGQKLSSLQKGLNIVDGKKVYVK